MRQNEHDENSKNVNHTGAASEEPKADPRELGVYRGEIWIADDFDAPLPPDVLAGFLGEDPPKRKRKKR